MLVGWGNGPQYQEWMRRCGRTVEEVPVEDSSEEEEMSFFGIELRGEHWVCFDEDGERPGKFEHEAARWGGWPTAEDIERINGTEARLITMDDIRKCIRERMPSAAQ